MIFSPGALTIEPGRVQLVRLTVTVPEAAEPGTYSTAVFVQQRPKAIPPGQDQRVIQVRVRYAFTLYVIVLPAASRPELVDLEVASRSGLLQLTCEMKNAGERHVRPLVMWSIRREGAKEADARGKLEATVLMPFSRVREPHRWPTRSSLRAITKSRCWCIFRTNNLCSP